jgi:hypothetical protein
VRIFLPPGRTRLYLSPQRRPPNPNKLVNPALTLPSAHRKQPQLEGHIIEIEEPPPQVLHVRGVVAQWDGADALTDCAVDALGLDRKLNCVCSAPAQAKIDLSLEGEVTVSPARVMWDCNVPFFCLNLEDL